MLVLPRQYNNGCKHTAAQAHRLHNIAVAPSTECTRLYADQHCASCMLMLTTTVVPGPRCRQSVDACGAGNAYSGPGHLCDALQLSCEWHGTAYVYCPAAFLHMSSAASGLGSCNHPARTAPALWCYHSCCITLLHSCKHAGTSFGDGLL